MARFALGSTTSPFTIKPLDFVCLALLIEFQNIQLDLSDQKPADSAAHPALSDEDVRTNYMLMEAILDVVTQTIFGNHDDSRLSRSISGVYGMLRAKAPDIDHLNIHQHIISINHTLNFAFQGTVDGLYEFTNRLYSLIAPPVALNSNPDDTVEFKLESPLGLYIRRCRLYVAKLEFDAVSDLVHHLKLFCVSECNTAVPIAMQGNVTPSLGSHSLRSEPECQPLSPPAMDPVTEAYLEFTEAYAPDYHRSSRALRRFYDTRCSMGATLPGALNSLPNDSNNEYIPGLNHQQALLSLAQFHYRTQGYPAAHDALQEATRLARLAGDKLILGQCACLSRRISYFSGMDCDDEGYFEPNQPPLAGPLHAQPGLQALRNLEEPSKKVAGEARFPADTSSESLYWNPNEEIFSAYKDLNRAEPLSHIYGKLFRAIRMTVPSLDGSVPEPQSELLQADNFDRVTWYAMQAKVWYLQGQHELCEVYEDLTLEMDEETSCNSLPQLITKTDVIRHRAIRLANRGNYDEALLVLLEEAQLNHSLHQPFVFLHHAVYEVLAMKAEHEGDEATLISIRSLRANSFDLECSSASLHKHINDLYDGARKMMKTSNQDVALPSIVAGITFADRVNLQVQKAVGVTLWAECMLAFEPEEAIQVILPKLREQRILDIPGFRVQWKHFARALLVCVRCLIARIFGTNTAAETAPLCGREDLAEVFILLSSLQILADKVDDFKLGQLVCYYRLTILQEAVHRNLRCEGEDVEEELVQAQAHMESQENCQKSPESLQELFHATSKFLSGLSAKRYLNR